MNGLFFMPPKLWVNLVRSRRNWNTHPTPVRVIALSLRSPAWIPLSSLLFKALSKVSLCVIVLTPPRENSSVLPGLTQHPSYYVKATYVRLPGQF